MSSNKSRSFKNIICFPHHNSLTSIAYLRLCHNSGVTCVILFLATPPFTVHNIRVSRLRVFLSVTKSPRCDSSFSPPLVPSLIATIVVGVEVSFSYTSCLCIVSILNGTVFFMDFVCLFRVSNNTGYLLFFCCWAVLLFLCFLFLCFLCLYDSFVQ